MSGSWNLQPPKTKLQRSVHRGHFYSYNSLSLSLSLSLYLSLSLSISLSLSNVSLSLSNTHSKSPSTLFPLLGPSFHTAVLHDAPRAVFCPARCGHIVQKRCLQSLSNVNYHTVAMFGDHRERWVESVEDHRGRRPSQGYQGRH